LIKKRFTLICHDIFALKMLTKVASIRVLGKDCLVWFGT